jgi:6-phospho-beta-glucosidase
VLVDGQDRLPELLDTDVDWLADEIGLPADLLRLERTIPSYYLHYYYCRDEVLREQLHSRSRAQEVMDIERGLLELYRDPSLDVKPQLLEKRGGAFYSEAAANLIASLYSGAGDTQVVNLRNKGAIPDLPDGAVVEIPALIDRDGAHAFDLAPLAPEIRGLVQAVRAYEDLAVAAAIHGDRSLALKALLAHPLVGQFSVAGPMLDALLEANRAYLPRFFR